MDSSTYPPATKPMPAIFAMGNTTYTGRDAIHQKITEQNELTEGMLLLRLNEDPGYFVLKLCGAELNNSEQTLDEPTVFTLDLIFLVEDVAFWNSSPQLQGTSLSNEFIVPVGHVITEDEPKRFIVFLAKHCQLAKTEIPRLEDSGLEQRMKNLVAQIQRDMEAGRLMHFKCVVDEYRTDRGTFKTIEESVEAEKPLFCNRCQNYGHLLDDCTVPKCVFCRELGHFYMECTNFI